ncbi:MAG: transposase, partial [Candidatus Competibacterales bacterium]
MAWLAHQHTPFIIRLKHNLQVDTLQGPVAVKTLFDDLERCKIRTLRQSRHLLGQNLFLSAKRLKDDTFVILAAPTPIPPALRQYRVRWAIERLFYAWKSGGFNLEDTHFTQPHRVERLVVLVALASAWAIRV